MKEWVEWLVQYGQDEYQSLRILIHDEVNSALDEFDLATKQDLQELASKIETQGRQENE